MSTTVTQQNESHSTSDRDTPKDVFRQISAQVAQCRSVSAFYRELLEICTDHFQAMFAAIDLCNAAESLDETFTSSESSQETWLRLTQGIMLESQADGVALAKLYDIDGANSRIAVLAVPLRDDQKYRGAVSLVVNCTDRAHAESLLFELRSLTTLACSLVSSIRSHKSQAIAGADGVTRAIERAAQYGSSTELAFAITNGLKTKFDCDQVVLGKVSRSRVHLLSLSGMDGLYPRSPGTRLIRQAMEECYDCGTTIYSRPGNEWSESTGERDYRLHRQWRSVVGDAAVASVPLTVDGRTVAVLSLVRPGNVGFRSEELEEIAQLAGAYAPALLLVARANRRWFAQTRESVRNSLLWFVARNHWGRRLTAAMVVAFAAWFCVGTWEYQLSTPCQLVPTRLHHSVAPYDGKIEAAYVEIGDHVKKGQLLYAMDTRDLELELSELRSESEVLRLEVAQASSQQDFQTAAMAQARLRVALAGIAGVERRIELAQVRAPGDGTIMAGDVERRVGEVVQLGEPLLEFAPHGSWAVELHVNSRDAQLVAEGQVGRFVTVARPDEEIKCDVSRIDPAATIIDGKTVYVVRADVQNNAAWSLAGMDGVATLDVGRRRVWWVVLHRAIDLVRLNFWV